MRAEVWASYRGIFVDVTTIGSSAISAFRIHPVTTKYIDDWTIEAHQDAHHVDLVWLNQGIEYISRSELFTHFCLSTHAMVVDPRHRNRKISSAFMTDLSSEPCWENGVVKLWAFGHTHFNCDFQDLKTGKTVTSNQRGYYFSQSEGFDCEKTVKI
ncbi:hypothetical protein VN97_g10977 [Penicillium thymicola]|uniref:Calcineurin-like phosphoesterase domain-containing protein n=1 Tax=Penicillium thymicola TaxID=293382 RepID=A0AAI9T815_PENTH|nr:hypothetical protein VN97_g10977 [Penicillium thymicola]